MKLEILIAIMLSIGAVVHAGPRPTKAENTFVGNGGNAGDLELRMTLSQIERATKLITEVPADENLCVCPTEYKGRAICAPLKDMNDEQKAYCEKAIRTKASEIQQLLSEGKVKWDWADSKMSVAEKGGSRDSDAVANSDDQRITIVRQNFISSKPPERVFLITHELLHLTKTDGAYLQDEAAVGPFKERDGGRELLNTLGSTMAMYAQSRNLYLADRSVNRRSKNYVNNWFSFALGGRTPDQPSTFQVNSVPGFALEYRRKFGNDSDWGVFGRFRYMGGSSNVLTSTTTKLMETGYAAGVDRQFSFFKDPMTYMGQSFLLVGLGIEYLSTEYKVADNFVSVDDTESGVSPLLRAQYFLPMVHGLWGFAEADATAYKIDYDDVNVKSQAVQGQFYLGVTYAF